jgi:PAS domain S-box-containing protein
LLGKRRWEEPNRFPLSGTWDEHRATLEAHEPFRDFEYVRTGDDGEQYFVSLSGVPIYDAAGNFIGYRGVGRNITERKQAEVALRESEGRYRTLIDWSPEAIAVHRGGKLLYVNPAAIKMFGASSGQDLVGKPILDLVHPDFHQIVLARVKNIADHGMVAPLVEERFLKLDGTVIDVEIQGTSIVYDGEPAIQVAMRDITERNEHDANLRRFRVAMDATADAIYLTDRASLRFFDVNIAACAALGLTREQILALGPEGVMSMSREELARIYDSVIAGGGATAPIEMLRTRRDGKQAWIELRRRAQRSGEGWMIVTVARDITERKQAEAAHASLEAQLRESQKMEAIGTLAGGIAHDFNNIIATILGNTELARQDVSANPQALQSLEEIRKAGSRARDLVQQILSFSRRQPTERKPTTLAPVVAESVRLLRATLPARLTLEVHCDAAVPAVLADATQIEQVLINLATNAMQTMHGRPGRIGIRLDTVMLDAAWADAHPALQAMHAKRPGRTVRLAVSDDGPGMDAATLGRIFEPFFTTRAVDEGIGLGLSVVHGIVQGHEGAIVVDSQPGKGSTFALYLPIAEVQAGAPEFETSAAAKTAPPDMGGGRHILYIDDDESLVLLVQRLLERRGYRVSGYVDQGEALDALRAGPAGFDLVVTDYNMPGMSGLDVARAVRAIRADLPVAVASGFIDEALRAQAEGARVRELIFKASAVEDFCEAFARLAQAVGEKSKSS